MCNIFTGWLHRKIKTDVFSESRNFRLWNRTSRLPILMMGTCLEELMEFSISLAETAWEKMGQWGHESSLSALSCLVPYLLLKQRVGRKVPNMTQLLLYITGRCPWSHAVCLYKHPLYGCECLSWIPSYFRMLGWDWLWSRALSLHHLSPWYNPVRNLVCA